tara:strand:- start:140 stop:637 length:498 start_codon:yes stop_codon:yes gene_type:complete
MEFLILLVIAIFLIWGIAIKSHNSKMKKKIKKIDAFNKCNKEIADLLSKYKIPKKTYFYDDVNINLNNEDWKKLESLKVINHYNAQSVSHHGLTNLGDTNYGEDASCSCCKSSDDKNLFHFKYSRIYDYTNEFGELEEYFCTGLYCINCGYISPFWKTSDSRSEI